MAAQPANTGLWLPNQTQAIYLYGRDDIILHKHVKLQFDLVRARDQTCLSGLETSAESRSRSLASASRQYIAGLTRW